VTSLLVALSLAGTVAAICFRIARARLAPLPPALPPAEAPAVFLVQPIVAFDAESLENHRAWLASAAAYPGAATLVWSTLEEAAPALEALRKEFPALAVHVLGVAPDARRVEPGVDKAHRLSAAMREVSRLAPAGGAVVAYIDADVVPAVPDALARLVAGAPRPGHIASVTIPPIQLLPSRPLWQRLQRLQARSLDQVLAVGALLFQRLEGIVQGYCSVLWEEDLRRLGGFEAVTDHLGEDIGLGVRAARAGLKSRVFDASPCLFTRSPAATLEAYARQQKRWSAMRRACPGVVQLSMLVGLPLKLPVVTGLLALLVAPGVGTAALAGLAVGVAASALARSPLDVLLLPAEELATVGAHLVGLFARSARHGPWVYVLDLRARISRKHWVGQAAEGGAQRAEGERSPARPKTR
jgi:hypothetical protein